VQSRLCFPRSPPKNQRPLVKKHEGRVKCPDDGAQEGQHPWKKSRMPPMIGREGGPGRSPGLVWERGAPTGLSNREVYS